MPVDKPEDKGDEQDQTMNILPVGELDPTKQKGDAEPAEKVPTEDNGDVPKPPSPIGDDVDPEDDSGSQLSNVGFNHPTSFETDKDPRTTTYCSAPHDPSKPIVQYVLTIDAGSTGSRIHVYKFHNCEEMPQLEYETFKMLNPGLSAFKSDPEAAARSLDPLMEEAKRVIPEDMWNCSPVEVKATAGLRRLGTKEADAILAAVKSRLETEYKFPIGGDDAIEIMDGSKEGVYAWITANYLLKNIGEGAKSKETLAVMDLGGASTQIVFEPQFASPDEHMADGDHKYDLKFGGKAYSLYQHSYLNYGLMQARRSVHNLVAFTWSFSHSSLNWDELSAEHSIANPCLSHSTSRMVTLDPPGRAPVNVTMSGSNGDYGACNRLIELVMAKDAVCEVKPCSFNGVYQPALIDTFPRGNFLALSYFYDRIIPLLGDTEEGKEEGKITLGDLKTMAQDVCAGPESWKRRWGNNRKAMAELEDRPETCLDLTFMHGLLGLGYEIREDRELLLEKKLNGVELGWALGAGLALVEKAEIKCVA